MNKLKPLHVVLELLRDVITEMGANFCHNFLFKLETRFFCDSISNKCTRIYSFPSHVQA